MAWGEEKCMFCDELVKRDGTSNCQCSSRITYRREPEAPTSAMRLYYNDASSPNSWQEAAIAFENLSIEHRNHWESKASADRARYECEKTAYNENLDLDSEILTDKEEEDGMECGNGLAELRQGLQRRRCEQQWARYRHDHAKYNQSIISPPDQLVTPASIFHLFLSLPPEIRSQIYTHHFSPSSRPSSFFFSTNEIRQWQLQYESADHDPELRFTHLHPFDTRLLAANRKIYTEALEVFYASKTFIVDIARASVPPLFVREASGVAPPRPSSKIRKWHVRLTFTDLSHEDSIRPQLALVRSVMASCARIDEVRFSWISVPDYWAEVPALRRAYDAMLMTFKDVRGVGSVVYTDTIEWTEAKNTFPFLRGWDYVHLASEDVSRDVKETMESPL